MQPISTNDVGLCMEHGGRGLCRTPDCHNAAIRGEHCMACTVLLELETKVREAQAQEQEMEEPASAPPHADLAAGTSSNASTAMALSATEVKVAAMKAKKAVSRVSAKAMDWLYARSPPRPRGRHPEPQTSSAGTNRINVHSKARGWKFWISTSARLC